MGSPIIASRHTGKVGTFEVELTKKGMGDELFEGFPETFWAHYGHRDVIAVRPEGSTLLAYGRLCHNAMLRYQTKIYTSQFHPELDGRLVQEYLDGHDAYIDSVVSRSHIKDTPHAESLPVRFAQFLRDRS